VQLKEFSRIVLIDIPTLVQLVIQITKHCGRLDTGAYESFKFTEGVWPDNSPLVVCEEVEQLGIGLFTAARGRYLPTINVEVICPKLTHSLAELPLGVCASQNGCCGKLTQHLGL
jgi:hypothetical protein